MIITKYISRLARNPRKIHPGFLNTAIAIDLEFASSKLSRFSDGCISAQTFGWQQYIGDEIDLMIGAAADIQFGTLMCQIGWHCRNEIMNQPLSGDFDDYFWNHRCKSV